VTQRNTSSGRHEQQIWKQKKARCEEETAVVFEFLLLSLPVLSFSGGFTRKRAPNCTTLANLSISRSSLIHIKLLALFIDNSQSLWGEVPLFEMLQVALEIYPSW